MIDLGRGIDETWPVNLLTLPGRLGQIPPRRHASRLPPTQPSELSMPLRKRVKSTPADGEVVKGDEKKSKRERLAAFFRSRKQRKSTADSDNEKKAAAAAVPVRPPLAALTPLFDPPS